MAHSVAYFIRVLSFFDWPVLTSFAVTCGRGRWVAVEGFFSLPKLVVEGGRGGRTLMSHRGGNFVALGCDSCETLVVL